MLGLAGRIILILLILATVGFFFREIHLRYRLVRLGRRGDMRWDRPIERLLYMIGRVGVQICAIKDRPLVGLMHALVFWGFMFFTVATLNHVAGAFSRGFSLWGHGRFNDAWFLGVDLIAVLTLVGVIFLAGRRYLVKPIAITQPQPISRSPQSAVVLSLIFGLMVTYLLNQGADRVLNQGGAAAWMPVSQAASTLFAGVSPSALSNWNQLFWWAHILMVLAFLVFIPHSKHLHLLAGPINLFFRSRQSDGLLQKIDFETTEQFGVQQVQQHSWKNISDFFSCVDCGRCQDVCPAYQSGKPLSPKVVMMAQRKQLLAEKKLLLTGHPPSQPVMDQWLTPDEIWACTTCGACMQVCPVMNEHIPAIVELRRGQVMMESNFPQELNPTFRGLETNANPWNIGHDLRTEWTAGLNVPVMDETGEADYLWFVGCAGAFDDRAKKISQAMAAILNRAGVSYAILGLEEKCCGDPARRAGNEYVFQMMADENVQTMKRYKFKKILAACPHGYHMIKNEYKQFGGEFEVIHHSELLAQLLREGKISLRAAQEEKITLHDSCYLGRYNALYQAPRQVLEQIPGGCLVEMPRRGQKSFCCGAGGGRMFMEETLGRRINHLRTEEAAATGAATVCTACPFCLAMLDDGTKEKGISEQLKTLDIAQLVLSRMEN